MSVAPYEILGGAEGLRALVDRFYDLMDELPEAKGIREMHAPDLAEAREKLYLFLSGWTGGPSLYIEKYGHPRLRARHVPFPIGISERDQWMLCMTRALEAHDGLERDDVRELTRVFLQTADFMRNKPGPGAPA
jgi:hemoglobin